MHFTCWFSSHKTYSPCCWWEISKNEGRIMELVCVYTMFWSEVSEMLWCETFQKKLYIYFVRVNKSAELRQMLNHTLEHCSCLSIWIKHILQKVIKVSWHFKHYPSLINGDKIWWFDIISEKKKPKTT